VRFLSLEDRTVAAVVEDGGYGVDPIPLGGNGAILKTRGAGPAYWRRRNLLGNVISYRPVVHVREGIGTLPEARCESSRASWNTARSQM